jgi:uncharacterized protein YndB with AHSA1/START domain
MKPVTVSIAVPQPREEVWDFLDALANHEAFTDHMLVDWQLSGPARGVGASVRMRLKRPGPADWMDLRVIEVDPPRRSTEESVGAHGRRRTRGTYKLEELPGGGTRIEFEIVWLEAPRAERLAAPITRAVMRRGNQRSLDRLAELLARRT